MAFSVSSPPETIAAVGSRLARVVLVLLSLLSVSQCKSSQLAAFNLMTSEKVVPFCLKYYSAFKELPRDKSKAVGQRVATMVAQDACHPLRGINLTGTVVLINDTSRCPLEVAARNFRNVNAYALVVGLSDNRIDDAVYERKTSEPLDIVVGFVSRKDFAVLLRSTEHRIRKAFLASAQQKKVTPRDPVEGVLFTKELEMDPSLILLWLIATFSVAAGAFWAASISYQMYQYSVARAKRQEPRAPAPTQEEERRGSQAAPVAPAAPAAPAPAGRRGSNADKHHGETSLEDVVDIELTPMAVIIFVVFMSSSLVIIYLFIRYIVYVIIGMFVLASSVALIGVLDPLLHKLPVGSAKVPRAVLPCFYVALEVRQVCLILLSIGVAFSFVVVRHHPKSWILQDSLGIIFCIYLIKTLRMPNLMVIATLLVLLFFYDIFFVFLTPLILPKSNPHNETNSFARSSGRGDSIMLEVAKGGGTDEQVPMLMRVPKLGNVDLSACYGEYALLGLGDILIPGFLVAYVHSFDLIATQRRLYYTVTVIGYAAGLVITFFALHLMRTGQPALLYLVPATLLPVVLLARWRGELNDIWYGLKPETPPPSEEESEPPASAAKRKGSEQAKAAGSTAEKPPGSAAPPVPAGP